MIQYDIKYKYIYIYAENQCREVLEFPRSIHVLFYLFIYLRKIGKIFVVLCEDTTGTMFEKIIEITIIINVVIQQKRNNNN